LIFGNLPSGSKKEQIVDLQKEGGDGKGTFISKQILFKIEGGDYEGVQSFSERRRDSKAMV
jgi:hypothetical protein